MIFFKKMRIFLLSILFIGAAATPQADEQELRTKAKKLAQQFVIADTHIDVPYRLRKKYDDISQRTEKGDFDYPRAKDGGLDAVFMSIFTPWQMEGEGRSKAVADSLIDMVEGFAVKWPDKFGIALSPAEAREHIDEGRIALFFGMENGSPLEGDLKNVKYFYDRGVRYITLTHSKDNHICDSSYHDKRTWQGLSPFGKRVVAEMNRLGIMIDVSHISDAAFYQVMETTRAPVIASHSSCRHFVPGWERNMDDEMIRALAKNGGVIQINFSSVFIDNECKRKHYVGKEYAERWAKENGLDPESQAVRDYRDKFFEKNPRGFADVSDVADHIDHVVKLVGVDHVGLGSDFDGVGDTLPTGLKDVSQYPNLIYELLLRGYTDGQIEKICSGNIFRVFDEVKKISAELSDAN